MLDVEASLELLKKYGYSSTNSHPYLYQSGDTIGICYTYVDEDYGTLERIKIFDSYEAFEEFLKQMDWLKKNGLNYHVRMCLDDYESINPKTLFLRNEKLMIEGEMDDIETFDFKEAQREQMDEATKILYEAGDLFLIYDEIKERQLQYLLKIISLKNQLRQKYFDLQSEVDKYNKVKIEREIVKIPEVPDSGGIDIQLEIALKDRYNLYIKEVPSIEEGTLFLKEVWDLNKNLELNTRYYDALREETEIRNEMKIVEKKLELMENLNENVKPLFGVDLVSKFRKINKSLGSTISEISKSIVEEKINLVADKYKYFSNLDTMYVSDYLREAIQNTNYEDLAIKYGKGASVEQIKKGRTPLNEIASSLFVQYKNSLAIDEQAILVLYNNEKYRKICDAILAIPDFNTMLPKQIVKKINGIKGFSKLKSECYISVRNRINDPLNKPIKDGLFSGYDFTSFETFIGSLSKELSKLKKINNKMHLIGDINMYVPIKNVDDVRNKEFILVTNDINRLTTEAKSNNNPIGITLLKENLPVMYSPYFFDLGDVYNKNASPKMEIREMINFELLIDVSDVFINEDKNKTNVINYYSEIAVEGNVSIVKDIKSSGKIVFVKYAFIPNSQVKHLEVQEEETSGGSTVVQEMSNMSISSPVSTPEVANSVVNNNTSAVDSSVAVDVPVANNPSDSNRPIDASLVAINQVNNGVDANNFNQSYNQVMEKAVESGSMVAIASQAANNDAVQSTDSKDEMVGLSNKDDDNKDPQKTTEKVISGEEKENKEENIVVKDSNANPKTEEMETKAENNIEKEVGVANGDKTLDKVAEQKIDEEPKEVKKQFINLDKKEDVNSSAQNKDNLNKASGSEEKDLDELLDTLATKLPKDLSKNIEDTSKMKIFADVNSEDEKESKSAIVKDKAKEEIKEDVKDKTVKIEEEVQKTPLIAKKDSENEVKETSSDTVPVKTQIVKKTITNPDGTKKVVMVKRTITTKPKESSTVPSTTEESSEKKVVKKIGQPVNPEVKKVIVNKDSKQEPKEEK